MGDKVEGRGGPSRLRIWSEVAATVVVYQQLLVVFIAVPPFLLPALGYHLNLRQGTAVTLGGTLVAELIALGLLLSWLRREGRSLADLGWRRPTTWPALVLGVAFGLLYAATTLAHPDIGRYFGEVGPFQLWGAAVGVAGAVIEEIIFRGFVLSELGRIDVRPAAKVIVSGLTFGLVHLGFGLWGIAFTTAMGMVLAIAYLIGRRSLTPPVIGHGLANLIIEPWLLLYTIYARMFSR